MESGKGIKIFLKLFCCCFLRSLGTPVQLVKSVEKENFFWEDDFFGN